MLLLSYEPTDPYVPRVEMAFVFTTCLLRFSKSNVLIIRDYLGDVKSYKSISPTFIGGTETFYSRKDT